MKNYLYGIFAIAFLAFTACTNEELPTPGTGPDTPVEHKSGEILVKFSPYVSEILDKTAAATRSGGPATRSGILSVDEVLDIVGGYQIERVFPVDGRNEERTRESELHLWYVVRFGDDYSAEEVAEKLSALGEVQHVNLNRTIRRAYNAGKKAMPLTREALAAMQRATRCRRGYGLSLQRRAAADAVAPDQPRQPVRRQVDRRCRRAVRRGVEILDGRQVDHRRRARRRRHGRTPRPEEQHVGQRRRGLPLEAGQRRQRLQRRRLRLQFRIRDGRHLMG